MVREDLIQSAVSFLQDPSVAVSPLEKRKAFLQSKNLTQEEIDIALVRAGEDPTGSEQDVPTPPNQNYQAYSSPKLRNRPPPNAYAYTYGPPQYQGGPWGQPPPPEPPRRDWRDWFIMATVTTGVGYGLYTVAKRYVLPLIAPPTPPQLEQDKAAIDASFAQAFALIDQLAKDTDALRIAELSRTERLDSALEDLESITSELKASSRRREDESRRIEDEVRALKELIPKALEGWKADGDSRLKDLGNEMGSLKRLIGNRVGGVGKEAPQPSSSSYLSKPFLPEHPDSRSRSNASAMGASSAPPTPASHPSPSALNGLNALNEVAEKLERSEKSDESKPPGGPTSPSVLPKRYGNTASAFSLDNRPASRAAIPAWQMAATASGKGKDVPAGGSAVEATGKEATVETERERERESQPGA